MFSGALLVIVLLLLIIWLWQSSMHAKEVALAACKTLCEQHHLQLLDDTISLKKIRLRRGDSGSVKFYRVYAFEYNTDGHTRRVGELGVLGKRVIDQRLFSHTTLTTAPEAANDATPNTAKPSATIIDFRQYKAQNDDKAQ